MICEILISTREEDGAGVSAWFFSDWMKFVAVTR